MKKYFLIILMIPFLWSCSLAKEDSSQNEDIKKEENIKKKEEEVLTEKEKLVNELPSSAEQDAWNLVLVNPDQALAEDFEPSLKEVDNEQRIDKRVVEAWKNWKEAAAEAGHQLFLASAYRDVKRQENNFNRKVTNYMNEGMTKEESTVKAKEYLTEPGHSEHHTGLALDIVDDEWIVAGHGLETAYGKEASQKWLVETMSDYGFILRYPEGKEDLTKIQYEPWHFRYVGPEHAHFMLENDLVLEEYIDLIKEKKD
ncbi:MAG: D-alanyl-D-alanine carboxypeptidase family protein [Atopostipes suicloacalis]|nr:D-alanyl-D-alanine carboxypeptidase family protein [Atopostipes suicloacalis]MDN6730627.1 D-alanyl-D-alanine carboxypeptidase family protein [Atopostipes suicloacalis]